jgi:protocatechuate 3,4-dioxygenase beta subunit
MYIRSRFAQISSVLALLALALAACESGSSPAAGGQAIAPPTPTPMANTLPASPTAAPDGGRGCTPTAWGPTTTSPIDDAPERTTVGSGHVLTGVVKAGPACRPLAHAQIIFWLAAPDGKYDDAHRAKVFTDNAGTYRFESNFPGLYSARPEPHIHLYVSAPGYRSIEQEYHPHDGETAGTLDLVLAPASP